MQRKTLTDNLKDLRTLNIAMKDVTDLATIWRNVVQVHRQFT